VPLSVEYEEKLYAAGRIPGSFFRREGRPADNAILTARVIDRPLRPLFPKDIRNDIQVVLMALSHDQEHQVDMIGIFAASCALMISEIPWAGPVAGVRIGLVDDQLVINPTISEMENSILDLRVAGTAEAINMIECAATEVPEDTMLEALELAHKTMQPFIELQLQMREAVGKPKADYDHEAEDAALFADVATAARFARSSSKRRIAVAATKRLKRCAMRCWPNMRRLTLNAIDFASWPWREARIQTMPRLRPLH
jgi:polyribonucleotide nucleotidyltransferase